jgi:hypothetical protein
MRLRLQDILRGQVSPGHDYDKEYHAIRYRAQEHAVHELQTRVEVILLKPLSPHQVRLQPPTRTMAPTSACAEDRLATSEHPSYHHLTTPQKGVLWAFRQKSQQEPESELRKMTSKQELPAQHT